MLVEVALAPVPLREPPEPDGPVVVAVAWVVADVWNKIFFFKKKVLSQKKKMKIKDTSITKR